jgi:predicted CoA-binding protein
LKGAWAAKKDNWEASMALKVDPAEYFVMVYYNCYPFQSSPMHHINPAPDAIRHLLREVHSVAVIGLSPNASRPSFRVAQALQSFGYRIIPVRPRQGGTEPSGTGAAASLLLPQSTGYAANVSEVRPLVTEVLGEITYPDLESLPEIPDIVDVFRAPQYVPAIVESCIKLGIKKLWLQDGVIHEEAALRAQQAGIMVVMDRCMLRDYTQLCNH